MRSFSVTDLHCDTLLRFSKHKGFDEFHFSLNHAVQYERYIQVFAVFVDGKRKSPRSQADRLIDSFRLMLDSEPRLRHITGCSAVDRRVGAILSIEGGEAIGGELDRLNHFHSCGVRMFGLTWNYNNLISSAAMGQPTANGLTEFGRRVVKRCEKLGIIVDLSHISERGFYDVAHVAAVPFVCSHSNSRAVCDHPRNLTDHQFQTLLQSNGVVGITMAPAFLTKKDKATSDDVVKHIEHFLSLGGSDYLALGTDFDGVEDLPQDIEGTKQLYNLINKLQIYYKDELIRKILCENAGRVLNI